jgi:hypothetical protein
MLPTASYRDRGRVAVAGASTQAMFAATMACPVCAHRQAGVPSHHSL